MSHFNVPFYVQVDTANRGLVGDYDKLIGDMNGDGQDDLIFATSNANGLETFVVESSRDGNDTISGGDGDDSISGGDGDDWLSGDSGADQFIFGRGDDSDQIVDFQDNVDTIELRNLGLSSSSDALSYAVQTGSDVVFDFGQGDVLTVRNSTILVLEDDISIV